VLWFWLGRRTQQWPNIFVDCTSHTHTQNLGSYTKKKKWKRENRLCIQQKKLQDFIQEKSACQYSNPQPSNHHYETHQYEALYFAFMLSATNWNCLLLMVNSHEKRLFDCETIKLLHTHNYFYWHQWKLLWIKLLFSCYNEERKKQIFLVHNVSNSTAFSNSFYKKMKKKIEKDNKMNIYSLPMMNKVASTTIW